MGGGEFFGLVLTRRREGAKEEEGFGFGSCVWVEVLGWGEFFGFGSHAKARRREGRGGFWVWVLRVGGRFLVGVSFLVLVSREGAKTRRKRGFRFWVLRVGGGFGLGVSFLVLGLTRRREGAKEEEEGAHAHVRGHELGRSYKRGLHKRGGSRTRHEGARVRRREGAWLLWGEPRVAEGGR